MVVDRTSPERERDPESIERLIKLRERLMSNDISVARLGAYNLSWMQEDGLTILKEALFGKYPRTAKKAAAYGLRNMKGRMKKLAVEALEQGLTHRDTTTQAACLKALQLMRGEVPPPRPSRPRQDRSKRSIQNISGNRKDVPQYRNSNHYTKRPPRQ